MKKLNLVIFGLVFVLCACSNRPAVHAVALAAGGEHTCALSETGGVRCWGSNANGQLGNGTLTDSPLPVDVSALGSDIVAVAAGGQHSCALSAQGRVWCWGSNANGQLGNGTLADSPVAAEVSALDKNIIAITTGDRHSCALSTQGRIFCWGANDVGQLGNKTKKASPLPVAVTGLAGGVLAVAGGDMHTCALTAGGGVKCWGANAFGQLGNKTKKASTVPVDVEGLDSGVAAIATGGAQSCALSAAGGVSCWGWDGNETTSHYALKPESPAGLESGVTAIAVGREHACALAAGDVVKCWGSNYVGQLGSDTLPASSTPLQISGLGSGLLDIAAGDFHTCVLSAGAGVQCWGQNDQGELGAANRLYSATPVRVAGLKTVALTAVAVTAAPTPTRVPPTLVPWPTPTALPTLRPGQPVTLVWLDMLNESTGWGIDVTGTILRTVDGGAAWKFVNPPEGVYDERSFYPMDANRAWAASLPVMSGSEGCERLASCHLSANLWRTVDGGASWQATQTWQATQPLSRPAGGGTTDGPLSAAAHNQYALDPATGWLLLEDWGPDTNILTVLARTSDGGQSLREIWRDEGIGRYTGLVFLNKLVGYLGLDETTFFDRLNGLPALKDYVAGTERPYLLKTTDGGRSWDVLYLPRIAPMPDTLQALASSDEHMLCGIEKLTPITPRAMAAEVVCRATGGFGPFSFYYLSSDGGKTWHSWVASGNERFLDALTGWRLDQSGQFQQTADGGLDWVTIKILPWQDARFDILSEQSGWALVTNAGAMTLMRTADGGQHWTALWPVVR